MTEPMLSKYQRAKTLIQGIFTKNIAFNDRVYPIWIGNSDFFWYERHSCKGKEYRLVNASIASNDLAFDHHAFAAELGRMLGREVDPENLPITDVSFTFSPAKTTVKKILMLNFSTDSRCWVYCINSGKFEEAKSLDSSCRVSPNGRQGIFIRNHNLWLRDIKSGNEHALTFDGEEEYAYGVGVPCYLPVNYDDVQIQWSPDSCRVYAIRRDIRHVRTVPCVQHVPLDGATRPQLIERKMPYPEDGPVETLGLLCIDMESKNIQQANYHEIPITRNSGSFFSTKLGWWANDSIRAYFVDVSKDYKSVRVVEFNTSNGNTKVLFEEVTNTHISLMLNSDESPEMVPLPETDELLWFSERSGWPHLYLYDMNNGRLKNVISHGDWVVRHIVRVDIERREAFIQTAGRSKNRDPYYRDLCVINLDSGDITTIASSDHDYVAITQQNQGVMTDKALGRDIGLASAISPSSNFVIVTRSRADEVPVSLLLDRHGRTIMVLEKADISGLPENWRWPEPVKLVADDGKTDIYGLVYRPSHFNPSLSYPVISSVYNSPDFPNVPKGSFTNGGVCGIQYYDAAALAELGFIVVQIDGRGTTYRSKAFFDECYGCTESTSNIDDHIAGMRQLCDRYSYMDINRIGITNHPSGGMGVLNALFENPDFYKVGVSMSSYDGRFIHAGLWSNKYEGGWHRSIQAYPEENAHKLKGKLLLMGFMQDTTAPVAGFFRVVDALQKGNKNFDQLLLPNSGSGYMVRRAWDYFVRNLLNAEPPQEFRLSIFLDDI